MENVRVICCSNFSFEWIRFSLKAFHLNIHIVSSFIETRRRDRIKGKAKIFDKLNEFEFSVRKQPKEKGREEKTVRKYE